MKRQSKPANGKREKPSVTLTGTVEKVIPPPHPALAEKAQIAVEEADHMYRELRIENKLEDENGRAVHLKPGTEVDVTIEADPEAIKPKDEESTTGAPK